VLGSIVECTAGNIERVARREADATCVGSVTYAFFGRHWDADGLVIEGVGMLQINPDRPESLGQT
jgi:hypothetical protein